MFYQVNLLLILTACTTFKEFIHLDPCPDEMVLLQKTENSAICLDRYELSADFPQKNIQHNHPLFNQTYYSCKTRCEGLGKRLPSNKEWLLGCAGTNPTQCNIYRSHPVLRRKSEKKPWFYSGKNCKDPRYTWGVCLKDPSLNDLPNSLAYNEEFSHCRSDKGAVNMIGNVGEWVEDKLKRNGQIFGRFNGGLYPQIRSSCHYTTIAHGPNYTDYSIGCRCAKDVIN